MSKKAKKITLSAFVQTRVSDVINPESIQIFLPNNFTYYIEPVTRIEFSFDRDRGIKEVLKAFEYNIFPLVVGSDGVPWAEANIYILEKIKNSLDPVMATYSCIASDLVAYKVFLDESRVNWTNFDRNKLQRPTYRYRTYLKLLIENKEIQISTARRRMSSIIAFYRWLELEGILRPEYPMWKDSDHYINININNDYGALVTKKIKSTDLSIKLPNTNNPYQNTIDDGGKLHPLVPQEQEWLLDALLTLNNYEMFLIHLVALTTGARIQSVLTLRVTHVSADTYSLDLEDIQIAAGPGTGIDTKNNKRIVLHMPKWVYKKLHIYVISERARRRREKSSLGEENISSQYLFLSNRGTPYYQSREELQDFKRDLLIHHVKHGQTVRQYISERVIPGQATLISTTFIRS